MSCYQLPAGVYTGSLWAYFVCMSVSVHVTKHSIARPSWRGSNCQTRIAFKWPMRCQSLRFRQPTELVDFSLQCDWCRNIGRSSRQKEERQVPVFSLFSLFTGRLPLERRLDVAFCQFSSRTAILPTPTFWNCPASHFFDKDPLAWLTSHHIASSSRDLWQIPSGKLHGSCFIILALRYNFWS